ncbi:hypothetical protein [Marivirga arenosa]|uniref:GLPGLI family protein n=1 Tax=Marivirga arenosa TaxID=3059076 RepID=A0AA49GDU6_9BACT|nr:hypothetical protein [Marivirga sp. BKB1-2]WKK79305.2 hypothetical protein QYS47_17925 [Marivirga sp. BKB1-2]
MKYYSLYLFVSCLLIQPLSISAQSTFQNGYIVTNENDTIFGQIKDRSAEPFGEIFKKVKMKKKWIFYKKYSPRSIKSYKIGDKTYESIWYDSYTELFSIFHISKADQGEKTFMRLAVDGELKLYWKEYRDHANSDGYEIAIPFFKKTNSYEMVRVTQGVLGFKKKLLRNFFSDCPSIVEKIDNGDFEVPEQIALYYNSSCN